MHQLAHFPEWPMRIIKLSDEIYEQFENNVEIFAVASKGSFQFECQKVIQKTDVRGH